MGDDLGVIEIDRQYQEAMEELLSGLLERRYNTYLC